jgi:hypothetical protein
MVIINYSEELDGPAVIALQRVVAEVKQLWIGDQKIIILSFGRYVKPS